MADRTALDLSSLPLGLAPSTATDFELLDAVPGGNRTPQNDPIAELQDSSGWVNLSKAPTGYKNSGDTEFGDYTKGFHKGTADIVSSILGAAELTGIVPAGTLSKPVEQYAQEIVAAMTPSAQENLQRRWTELGPEGVLRNPKAALGQLASVAPSVLTSIIGGVVGGGIAAGGVKASAALAGKTATKKSLQSAGRKGGFVGGVASEAPQIAGATINDLRQAMDEKSHEQLLELDEYRKQFIRHGDEATARNETLLKASRAPAVLNAAWGALVAGGSGAYFGSRQATKGLRGGETKTSQFLKGGAIEGSEEVAQEVPAQLTTGQAKQEYIDTTVDPSADMAETVTSSFFLGAGIGGPTNVALGGRDRGEAFNPLENINKELTVGPEVQEAIRLALPAPQEKLPAPEEKQLALPILPQDTSKPIAMPQPPGEFQPDMIGYPEQPVGPPNQRPLAEVPPPAAHVPEPVRDIVAQIAQMLDKGTNKRAVYIDPTPPTSEQDKNERDELVSGIQALFSDQQVRSQWPEFTGAVDEHGGLILTTSKAALDEYLAAGATEEARAKLLGYQQSKDQLENPNDTMTVAKINEDGSVAESQVVDAPPPNTTVESVVSQRPQMTPEQIENAVTKLVYDELAWDKLTRETASEEQIVAAEKEARKRVLEYEKARGGKRPANYYSRSNPNEWTTLDQAELAYNLDLKPGQSVVVVPTGAALTDRVSPGKQLDLGLTFPTTPVAEQAAPEAPPAPAGPQPLEPKARREWLATRRKKRAEGREKAAKPKMTERELLAKFKNIFAGYIQKKGQGDLFSNLGGGPLGELSGRQMQAIESQLNKLAAINKPNEETAGRVLRAIDAALGGTVDAEYAATGVPTHNAIEKIVAEVEGRIVAKEPAPVDATPEKDLSDDALADAETKRQEKAGVIRKDAARERRLARGEREKFPGAPGSQQGDANADALIAEARALEGRPPKQLQLPGTTQDQSDTVADIERAKKRLVRLRTQLERLRTAYARSKEVTKIAEEKIAQLNKKLDHKKEKGVLTVGISSINADIKRKTAIIKKEAAVRAEYSASMGRLNREISKLNEKVNTNSPKIAAAQKVVRKSIKAILDSGITDKELEETRIKERAKQWAERRKQGITEHKDKKFFEFRNKLLTAIRGVMTKHLGMSEEVAASYDLLDRHLSMQFTMGPADSKVDEETGRTTSSKFVKEMTMLDLASKQGDGDAILALLERKGLDAIAKILISKELGIREGKAFAMVKRWHANPKKVPLTDALRGKLDLLYNGGISESLTITKEQAEARAQEIAKLESEQRRDKILTKRGSSDIVGEDLGERTKSGDATVVIPTDIEGNRIEQPVDSSGNVVTTVSYAETVTEEPKGGPSGRSTSTSKSTSPKPEKSEQEKQLAAIAAAERAAERAGIDGEDPNGRPAGARRESINRVWPDGGAPNSVDDSVFEQQYPNLALDQRDGVRIMWQRILDNPEGAASIIGDGTGVGKTTQVLVVMDLYKRKIQDEKGRPAKILLVTPKSAIYKQFQKDSIKNLGLHLDGVDTVIYADLPGKAGSSYDLVIYDEAQKIAKATNSWSSVHTEIGTTHTIYMTATAGDKEENLALIAAVDGKTLPEFLAEADVGIVIGEDGIDVTTIKNQKKFLNWLADRVAKLRESYGYFRREVPRQSTAEIDIVEDYGDFKVTLSDGTKVSPKEAERMLVSFMNDPENRLNQNVLVGASVRLSELAKMSEALRRIDTAIAEKRKVIVLFAVQQKGKKPIVLRREGRKEITLDIPVAMREMDAYLRAKYKDESIGLIAGGAAHGAKLDKFQNGDMKVLLSTYQSIGEGLNLDATTPVEEGGWGRELIMMTDDWSADQMDQAHGRVDRAYTMIAPVVRRLHAPDFVGDIARLEKIQQKSMLQGALRGDSLENLFTYDKNIRVTHYPGGHVGVRIFGMMPSNPVFVDTKKLLETKRVRYNRAKQEHMLTTEEWNAATQDAIKVRFATTNEKPAATAAPAPKEDFAANIVAEAASDAAKTKAEKAKAVSAKRSGKTKVTKEQLKPAAAAVAQGSVVDPDIASSLDKLSQQDLETMEKIYTKALDTLTGDKYTKTDAELTEVYKAMERKALERAGRDGDYESIYAGDAGFIALSDRVMGALRIAGIEQATPFFRRLVQSKNLTPMERLLVQKILPFLDKTNIVLLTKYQMEQEGHPNAAGFYRDRTDTIYLLAADVETALHEGIHAVVHHAINTNKEVRTIVEEMMHTLSKDLNSVGNNARGNFTPEQLETIDKVLSSTHEFVSYGLTNPFIMKLLDKTPEVRIGLLKRLVNAIVKMLGVKGPRTRMLSDKLLELLDSMATTGRMQEGDTAYERAASNLGDDMMSKMGPLFDVFDSQTVRNAPRTKDEAQSAWRRKGLGFSTLRQLDSIYQRILSRLPTGNPVGKWIEAMHKQEQAQKKYQTIGHAMWDEYTAAVNAEDGKHRDTIQKLVGESTLMGIWPDRAMDAEGNKHLEAGDRAEWQRLNEMYKSSPVVSEIFDKLSKYYADDKAKGFELSIKNIFGSLLDVGERIVYRHEDGIETKIDNDRKFENVADNLLRAEKESRYDPANFVAYNSDGDPDLAVTHMLAQALRDHKASTLQEGPYFPLMRFGEWVVTAHNNEQSWSAELTAEEMERIRNKQVRRVEKITKKARAEWTELESGLFSAEVGRAVQKELRAKLTAASKEFRNTEQGAETDLPKFDGTKATMAGRVRWTSMHESEARAKNALGKVKEAGWNTTPNYVVTRKIDVAPNKNAANTALINHVRAKLELSEGASHPIIAALESAVIDSLPETAAQKRSLRRKGVVGFNRDHGRALASHVKSAAWYRGTLEHGREISRAITDITAAEKGLDKNLGSEPYSQEEATKVSDVLKEVRKHINLSSNGRRMNPIISGMGKLGFLGLLVSPAYVAVNLTQPYMYTMPWLKARQANGIPAWKAFTNAYKTITPEIMERAGAGIKQGATKYSIDSKLFDFLQRGADGQTILSERVSAQIDKAVSKGTLSAAIAEDLKVMLETLSATNVLDFTLALDTTAASEGRGSGGLGERTMDVARILPHLSEVLNRTVSAIAAYEMGRSQGMNHDAATEFATQAVVETQFDYTLMNKPRFMSERQNQLLKPIFMFMQHPQHVYALFVQTAMVGGDYARLKKSGGFDPSNADHKALEKEWKERRDTIIGILKTHLLIGGVTGAMFEPTKWALGLALALSEAITGEPPEDTEVYVRRWLDGVLGEDFGGVAADGLPTLLGLHLSDNLSISNLAAMNSPSKYSVDRKGVQDVAFTIGGPMLSVVGNAAQGVSDIRDGDVWGGLARMAPRVLREPMRAFNMSTGGLRDSNGNAIVDAKDMSPLDLFYTTLGLKPKSLAGKYRDKSVLDTAKNYHRMRRSRLSERLWRARGDSEATRDVILDIQKYNSQLPPGAPKLPTVISPRRFKAEQGLQEHGAMLGRNERYLIEEMR